VQCEAPSEPRTKFGTGKKVSTRSASSRQRSRRVDLAEEGDASSATQTSVQCHERLQEK
jgi:hypothetical protein